MQILGLQRRRQQPADHMEELRRQNDAHEPHQRVDLRRLGESGRHHAGERPREHHQHHDADAAGDDDEIGDGAEGAPAAVAIAAPEMVEEDRNEHDRQRAGGEEIVEEVGQREAREIKVGLAARTERAPDDLLAHEAHDAAQEDRDAPDRRGDPDGARLAPLGGDSSVRFAALRRRPQEPASSCPRPTPMGPFLRPQAVAPRTFEPKRNPLAVSCDLLAVAPQAVFVEIGPGRAGAAPGLPRER